MGMEPIADISGAELDHLVQSLAQAWRRGGIYTVAVCIDGGLKIKLNEASWAPPLGTVRPPEHSTTDLGRLAYEVVRSYQQLAGRWVSSPEPWEELDEDQRAAFSAAVAAVQTVAEARRAGITSDSPADLGPEGEALAAAERADTD
jgi:hypothetical protein